MRNARRSKSTKCAKSDGDPGAIRTLIPSASQRASPVERLLLVASSSSATPPPASFRSWDPGKQWLGDVRKEVVTRVRFERTTPSFGGWCSIQLSYRATIVDGRCRDHDITIEMNPGGA
jgi:hypothetical protein